MLQKGERVLIKVPLNELTASHTIKSFNGKTTVVEDIATIHGNTRTYRLKDCCGLCGVPFEFFEDWLIPLDRGV